MKRILLVAFACVFSRAIALREEIKDFGRDRLKAPPRHGEWVDIKSGDRTIKASSFSRIEKQDAGRAGHFRNLGLTHWVRMCVTSSRRTASSGSRSDLHSGQKSLKP